MGSSPSQSASAHLRTVSQRDDEERGVSNIRRMPLRGFRPRTQFTKRQVTAQQKSWDRI